MVPLLSVYELALPLKCIVQWDGEHKHIKRFNDQVMTLYMYVNMWILYYLQEMLLYFIQNPWKVKAAGQKVIMVPLILFSYDTSRNKSKKWHTFESCIYSWPAFQGKQMDSTSIYILSAARIRSHLWIWQDQYQKSSVSPFDMVRPILEEVHVLIFQYRYSYLFLAACQLCSRQTFCLLQE